MGIALIVLPLTMVSLLLPNGVAQMPNVPSIQQDGVFTKEQPGNGAPVWREIVENRASSSIVSFHSEFSCPGTGKVKVWTYPETHDRLIHYGRDPDIPPGGSYEISASDPSQCWGGVDAVVFSDGHSEGDPEVVNNLYQRRQGTYEELSEVIARVDRVAAGEESSQAVIDYLSNRGKSLAVDESINSAKRMGMSWVIQLIKDILTKQYNWGVPSDFTSRRGPSIDEVVASEQVSHERATAIVLARKLREWHKDLEANLEPQPGK
jgi:hypothetical protein